jgi:hypothetical protein
VYLCNKLWFCGPFASNEMPILAGRQRSVWLFILLLVSEAGTRIEALSTVVPKRSPPRGCAATPTVKRTVAVVGGGGYLGSLTFGFLQRAASLYGTGVGKCRAVGATPDTAVRLNRILSKNFGLAFADELLIELVDLTSLDALTKRLKGCDALIFGSEFYVQERPVGAGTFEKSPNDKT